MSDVDNGYLTDVETKKIRKELKSIIRGLKNIHYSLKHIRFNNRISTCKGLVSLGSDIDNLAARVEKEK
jgi:hypothetical protein